MLPIDALRDIFVEYTNAAEKYPPMNSAHEGYAVLKEEVDELWDLVKLKPSYREEIGLYLEAKQVAAMALRFMVDVCKNVYPDEGFERMNFKNVEIGGSTEATNFAFTKDDVPPPPGVMEREFPVKPLAQTEVACGAWIEGAAYCLRAVSHEGDHSAAN